MGSNSSLGFKKMTQRISILRLPVELIVLTRTSVFIMLSSLSFIVPFSLGSPQWLVGTIVNACLFLGVIFLPSGFYLPLIIFPSLGILCRGIIFGSFTPFLIYFLPFIWLSNLILIWAFKKLFPHLKYIVSVFCAATAKFLFLLIIANLYFRFHLVPAMFLLAMGPINFLLLWPAA